jgi:hypothetical protein
VKTLLVAAAGLVIVVAVVATAASASGHKLLPRGPEETMDRWLAAMAGAELERGWGYLSPEAQASVFGGDLGAYLREVNSVDWSRVAWSKTYGFADDGFFSAHADLLSDPRTLPTFIVERRLVGTMCGNEQPIGVQTYFKLDFLSEPELEIAHSTGSARRCLESFAKVSGPMLPPADFVSVAWATRGTAVRIGVKDATGSVVEVGPGRDDPPVEAAVTVSDVEPGQVGVAWVGTACDEPARIDIASGGKGFEMSLLTVTRQGPCIDRGLTFEVMLGVSGGISAGDFHATRQQVDIPGAAATSAAGSAL